MKPMKRVGKRGEGKFEEISWDEAYQGIADALKNTIDQYGNEAVYMNYGSGVSSATSRLFPRLANLMGGYLKSYADYSTNMMQSGMPYTYGDKCNPCLLYTSQLRKYKTKVIDRKLRAVDETIRTEPVPTKDLDQLMEELAADEEVVRVKEIEFEPLTEEEALVKIDLLGHDFFAYTDRDTSMVNVLYRRDDGGYGLLKQREEA